MKRIIISILLAVSFSALSAQNVIDTIIDTARYYYYYQWQGYDNDPVCDTCLTSFELPNTVITQEGYPFEQAGRSLCPYQSPIYDFGQNTQCNGQPGTAEYATRFYTSRPLQVVGLAVGMILKLCREEDAGVEARLDLRIWTPQGDSLLALDSVTVTHSNLARRHRVLNTMCPDAPGSYYYAAQPFYSLDDDVLDAPKLAILHLRKFFHIFYHK